MCIQILKKEIIPRNQYPNYTKTNLVGKATKSKDHSLMKVEFEYKSNIGTMHILVNNWVLKESAEKANKIISEIVLQYARANHYKVFQYAAMENRQKFIVH